MFKLFKRKLDVVIEDNDYQVKNYMNNSKYLNTLNRLFYTRNNNIEQFEKYLPLELEMLQKYEIYVSEEKIINDLDNLALVNKRKDTSASDLLTSFDTMSRQKIKTKKIRKK